MLATASPEQPPTEDDITLRDCRHQYQKQLLKAARGAYLKHGVVPANLATKLNDEGYVISELETEWATLDAWRL